MCSGEGACAVALDSNPPGPPANGQNLVRSRCGKPHVALMPRGRKGTCMDMAPTDDMKSSREFTAGSGRLPTTKRAADVTSAQLTSVSTRTTDQRVRRARAVKCARAVGCARTCTSRQDLASRYAACSRRSGPNACMQWREVKGSVHMATHEHMATHASHLVHRHLPRPRPRPLLLVHLGTRRPPRRPPPVTPAASTWHGGRLPHTRPRPAPCVPLRLQRGGCLRVLRAAPFPLSASPCLPASCSATQSSNVALVIYIRGVKIER